MILGMTTSAYTLLHVIISLAGIATGCVVLYGLLTNQALNRWTAAFLLTTVLTSVSGFGFPFTHLLPSHVLGILSLVTLTLAIVARYGQRLAGAWRRIYVVSAVIALYFNVFVLTVQSFEKVPALKALAPTQKESPFAITQLVVLGIFIVLTVKAIRRFRSEPLALPVSSGRGGVAA
jgi:hypothetical protein